jgi:hypothetical protein
MGVCRNHVSVNHKSKSRKYEVANKKSQRRSCKNEFENTNSQTRMYCAQCEHLSLVNARRVLVNARSAQCEHLSLVNARRVLVNAHRVNILVS